MLFMLVQVVVLVCVGLLPFVDNFAHIGGLATGLLSGMAVVPSDRRQLRYTCTALCRYTKVGRLGWWLATAGLMALGVACVWATRDIDDHWCRWCSDLNCLDAVDWCE
mmetsp:Transcript_41800/g.90685  ORF Transcript_41800/g.90685 Transcript_41800/m.90685 type:complete len:108 (-) Transcript_41800:37-360(-)